MTLETRYGPMDLPKSAEWIEEENKRRLQLVLDGKTWLYQPYLPLMSTGNKEDKDVGAN
jgi:hypothetical protein